MKITILGAGAWGTALAIHLSRQHEVSIWSRNSQEIAAMAADGENTRFLPGFKLSSSISFKSDISTSLSGAELVIVAVPTAGFRNTLQLCSNLDTPVIWVSKGFEAGTAKLLHQVADEVLPKAHLRGVLSGPSFAQEVAKGLPCALTLASTDEVFSRRIAAELHGGSMRVYSSSDVIGVELGGAVKNVMAIAAGISDGMGFGYNARAALITRGLAEMTRLGLALGGKLETFMGLAGVGDLILTCTGDLSRNRTVGKLLAQGKRLDAILAELGHAAEGVHTAREVLQLAEQVKVEMPITQEVCKVLFEGLSPKEAVEDLLNREPRAENLQ